MKQVNGIWLPDREEYLVRDILVSPYFAGAGTIQFKKYAGAFPFIRQFRHAVDIGANCGIWTRVMARCFPLVTCFEPNPECHEAFWANNPDQPNSRVVLEPVALGLEHGTALLDTTRPSTGFTRVDQAGNLIADMRTLDSFELDEVDFIKIDVEGWEHFVIRGGAETIQRCKPALIVEQKPDNAEHHGLTQFGAVRLLEKWGARRVWELSGDIVMAWPKL